MRTRQSTRQQAAAWFLLVAMLATGFATPWSDADGHGDGPAGEALHRSDHATGHIQPTTDHALCDAWTARDATPHARHAAARFEPADPPRHHHHAAVCGLCLHALFDLPGADRNVDGALLAGTSRRLGQALAPQATFRPRRSRAPPHA